MTTLQIKFEDRDLSIPQKVETAIVEFLLETAKVLIPKLMEWIKDGTKDKYISSDGRMFVHSAQAVKHKAMQDTKGITVSIMKIEYLN
jgi:hypothetical protein